MCERHRGGRSECGHGAGEDDAGDARGLCAACGCSVCAVGADLGDARSHPRETTRARLPAVLRTRYPFLPP